VSLVSGSVYSDMVAKPDTFLSYLVPSEVEEDVFWKRYWFRAWQIKQAEEKRKALLQGICQIMNLTTFKSNMV
jgi:hypothetical protein